MTSNVTKPILLLVEDEEDDAFFFARTFEQSGADFTVHHVSNGAEAIEFLKKPAVPASFPRIIFLDLKMPISNGFDVLAWMQKQTFPVPIPVVVLSGSEQQNDKDRARALGAADYLVKPLATADFDRVLKKII
jgi:CheY-like chemotaxis protein